MTRLFVFCGRKTAQMRGYRIKSCKKYRNYDIVQKTEESGENGSKVHDFSKFRTEPEPRRFANRLKIWYDNAVGYRT